MTEALAPGKLVVCGEYAVLEGAPALAVAVDAPARAHVTAAAECRLDVAGDDGWEFSWDAHGAPWWRREPPAGQGRVLEAVCATLHEAGLAPATALRIGLDTRAFRARTAAGGEDKLGLGSSAAITVALTAALLAHTGAAPPERPRLFALASAAHRRFQGGGSGVDIAAAVHGGVVALVGGPGAPAAVRPLSWPAGLHWLAAWSGSGASTRALLERWQAFRRRDAGRSGAHLERLRAGAGAALAAWESGAAGAALAALEDYQAGLRALDAAAGIGIWTSAHQRLADMATAAGALYKTSGAGGGDFGLALSLSAEAISRLAAECAAQGILTLGGRADVPGVVVTPTRSG